MSDPELGKLIDRMLLYFDVAVLAGYRQDAHRYDVFADNFEGKVSIRREYYEDLPEAERRVRKISFSFGFRARRNGDLAVVVWAPDICEHTGEEHRKRWVGFQLASDEFPEEFDARFLLWTRRYLNGDWSIEDGPLSRLQDAVNEINAVTEEGVASPLFKAESSSKLAFPNAENDSAYRDAHSAVYCFIIDGLDKITIAKIALALGISGKFDNDRTLAALKRILVDPKLCTEVCQPLEPVSSARGEAAHGVQSASLPFPAFERFSSDIEAVVSGLSSLRTFLAYRLKLNVERCVERRQMKRILPRFDSVRHSEAHYSIVDIEKVSGKTIARVEYGFHEPAPDVHDSELIILHFTDGSCLSISTGSNANNLAAIHKGLSAEDFHSSFALTFVPPARPEEE